MKPKLYLLLFFFFCTINSFCQDYKVLNSTNSALPNNSLQAVSIDKQGDKWIACKSGLYKYDGKQFTLISATAPGGYYNPIYNDSKNRTWVAFAGNSPGVICYESGKTTVFNAKNYGGLAKDIIVIKEGKNGKMFFGTSEGLITFDGAKWSRINLPGEATHLYTIRALDVSGDDTIAFGYDGGLMLFDGKQWQSYNDADHSKLQSDYVTALKFMPTGELYIGYGGGTAGGFSILKGNKWTHYNLYNSKMPDRMVRSIVLADNGAIWMGTNNGLLKIQGAEWTVIKPNPKSFANTIMGIAIENHKVWAATYDWGLMEIDN